MKKIYKCFIVIAIILTLLFPFSAFADETTTNAPNNNGYGQIFNGAVVGNFEMPDVSDYYIRAKNLGYNIFIFYNPQTSDYYFLALENLMERQYSSQWVSGGAFNCQFVFYNNALIISEENYYSSLKWKSNYFQAVYNPDTQSEWLITHDWSETVSYNVSFPVGNMALLAYDMATPIYNNDFEIYSIGHFVGTSGNNSLKYVWTPTLADVTHPVFTFDNSGLLIDIRDDGSSSEVTQGGLKGLFNKLKGWINTLKVGIVNALNIVKDGIVTAIGNIQGWLTTVKNAITTAIGNIQGWLSNLGDSISGFFDDLWDNITGKISDLGDWLESMFLLPDNFWTDYKNSWEALLLQKFGAVYQSAQIIDNLLDDLSYALEADEWSGIVRFPSIRFSVRKSGSNWVFLENIPFDFVVNAYDFNLKSFFNENGWRANFYNMWKVAISAILVLSLVFLLYRKLFKILSKSEEVGL